LLGNKVAFVTGGARGLGREIAIRLATEGCDLAICALHQSEALLQTQKEISSLGRKCLARKCDVSSKAEVDRLVAEAISTFGKIDILVNNAGGNLNTPWQLDETEEEDWDKVIDINLKGTFLCCKAVVPHMKRNGYGNIINISSQGAKFQQPHSSVAYVSAKAGVLGLTRKLAAELGPFNIRVNAVAPAVVMTEPMITRLSKRIQAEREAMLNNIPLRRFGEPKDISGVVLFLCSDDSSHITGATIDVTGGT
jgi:NAD(P)-dependent dehydrogenase (short-subunit alcohol dehydrogenase family)